VLREAGEQHQERHEAGLEARAGDAGEPVGQHHRRQQQERPQRAPLATRGHGGYGGGAGDGGPEVGGDPGGDGDMQRIEAQLQAQRRQQHPREVGVALDAIAGVVDEAVTVHEVEGVAKRDEGVVEDVGVAVPEQEAADRDYERGGDADGEEEADPLLRWGGVEHRWTHHMCAGRGNRSDFAPVVAAAR
jgi:hypothetical protein